MADENLDPMDHEGEGLKNEPDWKALARKWENRAKENSEKAKSFDETVGLPVKTTLLLNGQGSKSLLMATSYKQNKLRVATITIAKSRLRAFCNRSRC